MSYFSKLKKLLDNDGVLLLICTASIFLPFYLCAIPLLFTFFHAMRKPGIMDIFTPLHSAWFYVFVALGLAVGTYYSHWHGMIVFELLILLFLVGFYAQSVMTEKIRHDMITVISIGGIITAIASFIQKYPNLKFRSDSFFYNANYFAFVCEIVIVVLIYAIYIYGVKPLYLVAIAANFGGIITSECRTAWLAVFFGILVIMICLKKYRHLLILLGIGVLIGIGIYYFPNTFFPRFINFDSDKSLRMLIWKTCIGFIKLHPLLGQGMFTYFTLSTGRAHDTHAHDLILDLLVNFGFIGTAFITVFIVRILRDLVKNLRNNIAAAIALGVFAASFVHGFTDVPFIGLQSGAIFILMFAMSGVNGKKNPKYPKCL